VLSNPSLRAQYDQSGAAAVEEPDVNHAAFFTAMFGSEAFENFIGELSVASALGL
jgi:DnaJ-class molecular chaperone